MTLEQTLAVVILGGLFIALVIALILGSLLQRIFRNTKYRRIVSSHRHGIVIILFAAIVLWAIYRMHYPGDSFYLSEFEMVIDRPIDFDVEVLSGYATVPDWHGDYQSVARLRLNEVAHSKLNADLAKDLRFSRGRGMNSGDLSDNVLHHDSRVIGGYYRNDLPTDRYYYIQFLSPGALVEVFVSVN